MNGWQIAGVIAYIIATILTFYGSNLQHKDTQAFQEEAKSFQDNAKDYQKEVQAFQQDVKKFQEEQKKLDMPQLQCLTITNPTEPHRAQALIKNLGRKTAKNVMLIFSEESNPSIFHSNTISRYQEVHGGITVPMNLHIFSGINLIRTIPDSTPHNEYKQLIEKEMDLYNNANKAFVPQFYIEYEFEGKTYKTDIYMFLLEKNRGIFGLGKHITKSE